MTKLPNLTAAEYFINRKRRVKARLQNQDYELLGLRDRPERLSDVMNRKWPDSNVKVRSSITLPFAEGLRSQDGTILYDEERTAKDLS